MYCGLFSIFVIKSIQPDCDKIKGISVLLLETPLTRSKFFSPYTHTHNVLREHREPSAHSRMNKNAFIGGESDVPWKERNNSGSSVADCVHTAIFQNIRENRIPYRSIYCKPNPGRSPHTRHQIYIYKKIDK